MGDLCPAYFRAWFLCCGVRDNRGGSCGNGSVDMLITIARFSPHGDENISPLHPARVIFDTGDVRVAALGQHLSPLQELLESH